MYSTSMDMTLPLVTRYQGKTDGGPCDDGATAVCPHCGADGRYIHWFECEDGSKRGAMSGCIKLFRFSDIAAADMSLSEKEIEREKNGKGLNAVESRARYAIDQFYAGRWDEPTVMKMIESQKQAAFEYRRSQGWA